MLQMTVTTSSGAGDQTLERVLVRESDVPALRAVDCYDEQVGFVSKTGICSSLLQQGQLQPNESLSQTLF